MNLGGFLKAVASPLIGIAFAAVAIMQNGHTTRVLVAKHDLFPNQALVSDDLTLAAMRDNFPGMLTTVDRDSVVGLRVASRIPAGYPVLKADLKGKPGVGMTLADTIPDADHAIYQLDGSRAHLPMGEVKPGDTVMISVVLKMDAAQQAALAQAQASPTPTPAAAPKPSDAPLLAAPPPVANQAPLILASQFVTAPVVAVPATNASATSLVSNDRFIAVLLTLDNHNALTLLQGSGLADITVSLASSDGTEAGRVNTFTQLVNVLEKQERNAVAPGATSNGGAPAGNSSQPSNPQPSAPTASAPPAPANTTAPGGPGTPPAQPSAPQASPRR